MAFEIEMLATNTLKQNLAGLLAYGTGFKITHFVIGNQGHDPSDPSSARTPDPTQSECYNTVFGPKAIESVSRDNFVDVFECFLDLGEATGTISSLCLLGTIVAVNDGDQNDFGEPYDPRGLVINNTFVAAIATMPLRTKADTEDSTFFVRLAY